MLLWLTFLSVIYSDLQTGILAGILYSVVFFAYRYSQARSSHLLKSCRSRQAADIPGAFAAVASRCTPTQCADLQHILLFK